MRSMRSSAGSAETRHPSGAPRGGRFPAVTASRREFPDWPAQPAGPAAPRPSFVDPRWIRKARHVTSFSPRLRGRRRPEGDPDRTGEASKILWTFSFRAGAARRDRRPHGARPSSARSVLPPRFAPCAHAQPHLNDLLLQRDVNWRARRPGQPGAVRSPVAPVAVNARVPLIVP